MNIRTFKTKLEMDSTHQKEVNEFPFVFAFSDEQFRKRIKEKWNLDMDNKDHLKQIYSIGAGGFILKSDSKAMHEMFDRHSAERKQFTQNFNHLVEVIKYEMANHEYGYTGDPTDALNALSEHIDNPRFAEACKKAEKEYLKEYRDCNETEAAV